MLISDLNGRLVVPIVDNKVSVDLVPEVRLPYPDVVAASEDLLLLHHSTEFSVDHLRGPIGQHHPAAAHLYKILSNLPQSEIE